MAHYIDAFAIAVPKANREAWEALSATMAEVFKENGALAVVNCWGVEVPDGKLTSFPLAVKREENETVTIGWTRWPSREARDAGMGKAMSDPRMKRDENNPMPFDGKRIIFGGFEVVTDA
jgi:uncharacterized protein YbaA (DUF1428 family)